VLGGVGTSARGDSNEGHNWGGVSGARLGLGFGGLG